jgi:hypothetical protein
MKKWYFKLIHKIMFSLGKICEYLLKYLVTLSRIFQGPSWSWLYGSWINNYLCNQCLSPLQLWVWTCSWWGVLNTTLCDKVCQWLVTGWWFSSGFPVSSTNKSDHHDITEIFLKVTLNTINLNHISDHTVTWHDIISSNNIIWHMVVW